MGENLAVCRSREFFGDYTDSYVRDVQEIWWFPGSSCPLFSHENTHTHRSHTPHTLLTHIHRQTSKTNIAINCPTQYRFWQQSVITPLSIPKSRLPKSHWKQQPVLMSWIVLSGFSLPLMLVGWPRSSSRTLSSITSKYSPQSSARKRRSEPWGPSEWPRKKWISLP